MTAFDALLGRVWNDGSELELQGGIDFRSGLRAVANTASKRLEVSSTYEAYTVLVAVGDSVSDALAAADAAGGGRVLLDIGTHTLTTGELIVPAGVILSGVSRDSTVLQFTAGGFVRLQNNGSGLSDIHVKSDSSSYFVFVSGDYVTIERVTLESTSTYGPGSALGGNGANYLTVRDARLVNPAATGTHYGVRLYGAAQGVRLENVSDETGPTGSWIESGVTGAMVCGMSVANELKIEGDDSALVGISAASMTATCDNCLLAGVRCTGNANVYGHQNAIIGLETGGYITIAGYGNDVSGAHHAGVLTVTGTENVVSSSDRVVVQRDVADVVGVATEVPTAGAPGSYTALATLAAGFVSDGMVRRILATVAYGVDGGAADTQEEADAVITVTRSGADAATASYKVTIATPAGYASNGPSTTPAAVGALWTPANLNVQASMAAGVLSLSLERQVGTTYNGLATLRLTPERSLL